MTRRRAASPDRFEDLLDGGPAGNDALTRLLAAARAPGSPDEVAGLPAARTAYLAAKRPRRAIGSRLPAATRTATGRLLVLKGLAALSGATLIGGVAYAATGAHLLGGSSDQHRRGPGSSAGAPAPQQTSAADHSGRQHQSASGLPGRHAVPGGGAVNGHPGRPSSSAHAAHRQPAAGNGASGHPGHPSHPSRPAHPSHPAHPSRPAHPSHPAHPGQPAHPSHPAQPGQPAHPSRPAH